MKNIIKIFLSVFITTLFLFIFMVFAASCRLLGPQEDAENEQSEAEEETISQEELAVSDEVTTSIDLWDCLEPKERLVLMDSRDNFMMDSRDIDLEIRHFRSQEELMDQFEAASLAGSGPQLLLLDFNGVERLAPGNVVKEIVDEVDYGLILDGLVEISNYENRDYIVPFRSSDFLMFIYNRDLVKKVPGSFEEIIQYNMEEDNFEEGQYGFLLNVSQADWVIPFIGGYGGWIVDYNTNSLTLDSQATEKTLEFINYVYNEEKVFTAGIEYGDINELFKSGNAHMIIDDLVSLEEYRGAGINLGVEKIPRVWQGINYPTPIISGLGFMININTYGPQLDAAKSFISYMLSEEVQMEWNGKTDTMPALKEMEAGEFMWEDSILQNAFGQALICRGEPYGDLIRVIRNAINDNVESLLAGEILPAEAASKIQGDAIRLRSGKLPVEEDVEAGEDTGTGNGSE